MKRSWLIAGAVVGCFTGAAVGACGSSTGSGGAGASGVTVGATSSGKTTGTGSTTTTSTGSPTTTTGSGMGGAGGGSCTKAGILHAPKADAGVDTLYCPFSAVDGGKNISCDPSTDHCCETKAATPPVPSTCEPLATACGATDTDWGCEDPIADCGPNMECCATGTTPAVVINTAVDSMGNPCANYATGMKGTACVAKGTCNTISLCTSDHNTTPSSEECGNKKCTPFSKAGNQLGACL